ncbi:MAG TPA: alpha-amylase family glycosyl hydrolase [Candidatus Binatia bacterium]|jgi:cyclomaltodextrinase|nr:alpha-amylase family glycosyl hydrolase [Candidatus Binatia bacterium]
MNRPSRLGHLLGLLGLLLNSTPLRAGELSEQTARTSPQWLRDGVIYEIFPRNFSPEGNFNGITARLDELKDLGVDILWLMPIHPIGQKMRKGSIGSPYAVSDYSAINPDYGTEKDFKRLISEAHQRGMKVIIDMVANHTAWDSVLMAHPEFYKQDGKGKIIPPVPEWTDVAGLNYENPKLREYMIGMLKHWIDPATFDLDGFRCDVAYMVPTSFWEEARAALVKVKPDIMLLAEASKPELLVKAFDADYSWPLHATLNNVLLSGAPASDLRRSWDESLRQFPQGSLHMRISDNHDEARAVARFGTRGALAASVLMLALDGVPLLYNGMEVGDATESGEPALFEKVPIFWHPKERPPLRDIYRDLIKLRKAYAPFRNDRVIWLHNSDEANLVTLLRLDAKDEFVVAINLSNRPNLGWVEVMHEEQFKPVKIAGVPDSPTSGFPLFRLNSFEWRIYHRAVKEGKS